MISCAIIFSIIYYYLKHNIMISSGILYTWFLAVHTSRVHLDSCRRTMLYVRRMTSYNTDVAHDVVRQARTTSYTYDVVRGARTTSYIDVVCHWQARTSLPVSMALQHTMSYVHTISYV
jgi:hypothetical protein